VAGCGPDVSVVDVIDPGSHAITRTREVGDIDGILTGLSISGDGDRAYVVTDTGVTVLCTLTHDIVGAVPVTDRPSRVLESPDGRWLYVADHAGVVTAAPVASITGVQIAGEAGEDDGAASLVLPDLSPREPALV
jgi:DNA-binding beta-propeller fold protein YncE